MHERGNWWFHPAWVSARDLKGRRELFAPWMLSAPAGSWCPTVTATAAVLLLRHLSTSAANESGIWHSQQQRLCKSSLFQMHEGTYLVQIQDRGKSSKEVSIPVLKQGGASQLRDRSILFPVRMSKTTYFYLFSFSKVPLPEVFPNHSRSKNFLQKISSWILKAWQHYKELAARCAWGLTGRQCPVQRRADEWMETER